MVIMTTGLRRTMFHMVLDFFRRGGDPLNLELRLTMFHGMDDPPPWNGSGLLLAATMNFGAPPYDYPHYDVSTLEWFHGFPPGGNYGAPPYDYPHYDYPPWNGSGFFPPVVTLNLELHRTITRITITLLGMVPDFLPAATMNLGLRRTITRITIILLGMVPDFLLAVIMELRRTITRITITLLGMVPDFLLAVEVESANRRTITRITITLLGMVPDFLLAVIMESAVRLPALRLPSLEWFRISSRR